MADQSLALPDSMCSSPANHSSSSRSLFTSLQPDQSQPSSSSDSTPPGLSHSGNFSIMFSQGNLSLSSIQLLSRAQLSMASAPQNSTSQLGHSVTQESSGPIQPNAPSTELEGLGQIAIPDGPTRLEMKEPLNRAMQWLEEEPLEKASTAATIFNVNPASIRMRQYRKGHQERNSRGTYNRH